ncbi:MAG: dipeptidase [Saprospiraceae bacterium]
MKFIVDAHLDLSMNAMEWNRDLSQPVTAINQREKDWNDKPDRGLATVSLEALRAGNIGLCVATQIARYVKTDNPIPGWHSPYQAWAHTQGQLAWYRAMEKEGHLVQIKTQSDLKNHLNLWPKGPIGYILSLEGADSIVDESYLEEAYLNGLRAIGLAHYGPGTYAFGTNSSGSIGQKGKNLLKKMESLGIILDMTHLCDVSFWESMDNYHGPLWASHNNCRALVKHNRQFDDQQIKAIAERGGIIGVVFDAWMIIPNWKKGQDTPLSRGLDMNRVIDHIDHICQITGNCNHVGIGSDLDGGFGKEQCPADIDTIADLQKLDHLLFQRGYDEDAIQRILSGNFLNFLKQHLPKS